MHTSVNHASVLQKLAQRIEFPTMGRRQCLNKLKARQSRDKALIAQQFNYRSYNGPRLQEGASSTQCTERRLRQGVQPVRPVSSFLPRFRQEPPRDKEFTNQSPQELLHRLYCMYSEDDSPKSGSTSYAEVITSAILFCICSSSAHVLHA